MLAYDKLLRLSFDTALMVLFFKPILRKRESSRLRMVLAILPAVLLVPVYFITTIGSFGMLIVRFAVRALVYAVFVREFKGASWSRSLYFGVLCWIVFTCENNTFLTPQLSPLRTNQFVLIGNPLADKILCKAIEWLMELGIVLLVRESLPMKMIYKIDRGRWIVAGAVVLCELYIKYSLQLFHTVPGMQYPPELTIYPILLQILIILFLIFFERYLYGRIREEHVHMSELSTHYLYENARTTAQADAELRQLNHDLKNHFLVLQHLSEENPAALDYIHHLVEGMTSASVLVETGNGILNGLISEKMRQAKMNQIDLNACVDFRAGSFIEDPDVCAIFGNVLDNALEACARIPEPEKRSISLKCATAAKNLVITCVNFCQDTPEPRGMLFASKKRDSGHGLGLSSILKSARKYGGTMTVDVNAAHNFVLTVLIPLP